MLISYRKHCKPIKFLYAEKMRANPTIAENILWKRLYALKSIIKFRQQSVIYGYIVDFYCPQYKLVIELDGEYHGDIKQQIYDLKRTDILQSIGMKVIRFTNQEVIDDVEQVIKEIAHNIDSYRTIKTSIANKKARIC